MKNLIKFWCGLSALTRSLYKLVLFNLVIVNLLLMSPLLPPVGYLGETGHTVLQHLEWFFKVRSNTDSWLPMSLAHDFVQSSSHNALYAEVFFEQNIKYQYPPASLLVIHFLKEGFVGNALKAINVTSDGVLKGTCWLSVVAIAYFAIRIFDLRLKQLGSASQARSSSDRLARSIAIALLAISFYPVIKAYTLGQIQTWLNVFFAAILWLWMNEKKGVSGVLAGIMCLIKPQYALFLVWATLRRQWTFLAASVVTLALGIAASFMLFSISDYLDYFKVLSFISRRGESFYANQSFNGLINRVLFNGDNLFWDKHSFPPFNPIVYYSTLAFSIALVGIALFSAKRQQSNTAADLAILALTATIASPVAWEHHFGILLPIYAYLLPSLLHLQASNKLLFLLTASYCLTSNSFVFINHLAYAPFNLNIFQSYLFFGALLALVLLYVVREVKQTATDRDASTLLYESV